MTVPVFLPAISDPLKDSPVACAPFVPVAFYRFVWPAATADALAAVLAPDAWPAPGLLPCWAEPPGD